MNLSALEEWVVDALLRRVRVLATLQIEAYCRTIECQQTAQQAIRKLKRVGLVESFKFDSTVLELKTPLIVWQPNDPKPDNFSKIAWQAKSRFMNSQVEEHQILLATATACRLFGGVGGSLRQPGQILHDLGTSSVYIGRKDDDLDAWTEWIGEDTYRRSWRHLKIRKVPDACLIADESVVNVIEFAGRDYGKAYLEKFHHFWKARSTPYEIW